MTRSNAVHVLRGTAAAAALLAYQPSVSLGQQADSIRRADSIHVAGHGVSDSLDVILKRAGYSAIPMRGIGHMFFDVKFDTATTRLLLDSGAARDIITSSSAPGARVRDMKAKVAGAWNISDATWGTVDRMTVGPLTLTSLEGVLSKGPLDEKMGGLMGALVLNRQGAIIDYATHTLYLLPAPTAPGPAPAQRTTPAPARTLRAALEAAGQYRTFLELAREAGLMPLLESAEPRAGEPDSVVWSGFRTEAFYEAGVAAMPDDGARYVPLRQGMNKRLGRRGQRTVFVPTDAAFAQLSPDTLRALRADRARLAEVLRAHVLANIRLDTVAMRTLVQGASQPAGPMFGFHPMGARIDVDRLVSSAYGPEYASIVARATIVQPDLAAANGLAHGIDRLLIPSAAPPSPLAAALAGQGYTAVPLYRLRSGYFAARAKVDTVNLMLVLDTGAPGGVALDKMLAWRVFDLDNYEPPEGESIPFVLDSIVMPPIALGTVDFVFINEKGSYQNHPPVQGLLGSHLMDNYHARLDHAAGMLYLRLPARARSARSAPAKP